jgi:hypothetical protein
LQTAQSARSLPSPFPNPDPVPDDVQEMSGEAATDCFDFDAAAFLGLRLARLSRSTRAHVLGRRLDLQHHRHNLQ